MLPSRRRNTFIAPPILVENFTIIMLEGSCRKDLGQSPGKRARENKNLKEPSNLFLFSR
jgi:hypothetical protein